MSIASEVQTLITNKLAIKNSILARSPTTSPGDNLSNWPASIESIPVTIIEARKPVKFRDCDGTILYTYSAEEALALDSMPILPSRVGLVCQGWNWTLEQMKEYVSKHGVAEIGAVYTTDDGSTRIQITIKDPMYSTVTIVWNQSESNGVVVDWGDGSDAVSVDSNGNTQLSHTYVPSSYPAQYNIKLTVVSGTVQFYTNIMGRTTQEATTAVVSVWMEMVDAVNIGQGVTDIGQGFLFNAANATIVTLPLGITSIDKNAFCGCMSLRHITLPSSVESLTYRSFAYCRMLQSIALPYNIKISGSENFIDCIQLKNLVVPDGAFTSVPGVFLKNCYSLQHVSLPSTITSIGNSALQSCNSLQSIDIPNGVTTIGVSAFQVCYQLQQIVLPDSVGTVGTGAFAGCECLQNITLSKSMTSVSNKMLQNDRCLIRVQIPESVNSIDTQAFSGCYGLKLFDFRRSTSVPTLLNIDAFKNTPTDKEIVVPDELYDVWIEASNWKSSTNQIKESIVKASESSIGTLN